MNRVNSFDGKHHRVENFRAPAAVSVSMLRFWSWVTWDAIKLFIRYRLTSTKRFLLNESSTRSLSLPETNFIHLTRTVRAIQTFHYSKNHLVVVKRKPEAYLIRIDKTVVSAGKPKLYAFISERVDFGIIRCFDKRRLFSLVPPSVDGISLSEFSMKGKCKQTVSTVVGSRRQSPQPPPTERSQWSMAI